MQSGPGISRRLASAMMWGALCVAMAGCASGDGGPTGDRSPALSGNLLASYENVRRLEQLDPAGTEFDKALSREYLKYAKDEIRGRRDYVSGDHFAKKGLQAGFGQEVDPELPSEWSVAGRTTLSEMASARNQLVVALEGGAKESKPELAAAAQASFDCWVEHEAHGYKPTGVAACRERLMSLLAELHQPQPAAVEAPPPVPAPAPPPQEYVVHFAFNSAAIRPGEYEAIRAAAAAYLARRDGSVVVQGHTDTVGSDTYNLRLSQRRAEAVANALAQLGVSRAAIDMDWYGERLNAVPTGDGVRSEANRRVTISLR